ncbi:hypothetical protein ACB094_03G203300 [Castanea mollissima]
MDEYVGNGVLKGLLPKLVEEGWGDVPTLKIMNSEDMNELNMTQQQKDALEIRSYLHDRGLIQYGDEIESDGRCLSELLNLGHEELSSQFGMKRGHIARFMDRTSSSEPRVCGCVKPPPIVDTVAPYSAIESISIQKLTPEYKLGTELLVKTKTPPMKASELWRDKPAVLLCIRRPGCIMCRPIRPKQPDSGRICSNRRQVGVIQAASTRVGWKKKENMWPTQHRRASSGVPRASPRCAASGVGAAPPAPRPCFLEFDALGVQLFAVLHEQIDSEVKDFWPRYWGGALLFDRGMEFFEVLGGGKLLKEKFLSGFVFNPRAIANYKRAKAMGIIEQNFRGEGEVKGGLFILGSGKSGIAYQFIERNFGDWAPIVEVIEICTQLQQLADDCFPYH